MKILVIPSFYPDASNSNLGYFFKQQSISLCSSGNEVYVAYSEQKSLKKLRKSNIFDYLFNFKKLVLKNHVEFRYIGFKIPGNIGNKIWIHLTYKLAVKLIDKYGMPDIVHAHNCFYGGLVAEKLKLKYGINFIITEHDSSVLTLNLNHSKIKVAVRVYNQAKNVIAVSSKLANSIKSLGINKVVDVIPNIVDVDFFKPLIHNSRKKSLKFVSVGNLTENKNHKLLIDAFELLTPKYKIELLICGVGPNESFLKDYIKLKKLENNVNLLGYKNRNELLEIYNDSICILHSSFYETFGVVLIEAMSCGIPFISTRSGGPEDIHNDDIGILLKDFSHSSLADVIENQVILKNRFNSQIIRKYILDNYSPSIIVDKIIKVINEEK